MSIPSDLAHHVTATRHFPIDSSTVWEKLKSIEDLYLWHPGVKSSRTINEVKTGVGAGRISEFYDGVRLKEVVIDCKEGWQRNELTIEMNSLDIPSQKAYGTFAVVPRGQNACDVAFTFAVSYGVVGKVISKMIHEKMLPRVLGNSLDSLELHLKSENMIKDGEFPLQPRPHENVALGYRFLIHA